MADELRHRTARKVEKGAYYPLGATLTPDGVNFAVHSKDATEVFLLLFEAADGEPTDIIQLGHRTKYVWHALVKGLGAGQRYGYKVRGPYRPQWGLRFNERKLLLDPYAKAVTGKFRNVDNLLLAYDPHSAARDGSLDMRDNTRLVPKSLVVDDAFDWQGDTAPDLALEQLIIYEVHVKGFTAHPSSGVEFPGTYLGFIEKIPHLTRLGVNAVELVPVHESYVEDLLIQKGLTNYWGYNSIGFFAPESSYSTGRTAGGQVAEFKTLVRALHRAGIKVILDVVYNHSGEGNEMGPTLCFRGLDNLAYYSLTGPEAEPRRYYMNYTGCENNQDGANDNHSWNCGVEGDTNDPGVLALRRRLIKNHACHLLFASGTPMILGGDEFMRTQQGNNNAYCQDNEISWFDWTEVSRHPDILEFFRKAIALTRRFPILQHRKFLLGQDLDDDGVPDLTWFGVDLGWPAWHDPNARTLCAQLDASEDPASPTGTRLFFIYNAHWEVQWVKLPALEPGRRWSRLIDTSLPSGEDFQEAGREVPIDPPHHYIANPRSTVVLLGH